MKRNQSSGSRYSNKGDGEENTKEVKSSEEKNTNRNGNRKAGRTKNSSSNGRSKSRKKANIKERGENTFKWKDGYEN